MSLYLCKPTRRHTPQDFFFIIWNRQSEYKVFHKLMGWLWVKLLDVLAWWSPLMRGDLVHRITGQLATVISVFVRRHLVECGRVVGSSEFRVLYGAWYFCRWMTFCTVGIPRSSWITALVTYHRVSTIVRNILDWHLCMMAVLDLQARPHNSMP